MPVLIKTSEMQYKDNLGNYHGVNAIAEKKIADQIADLDVAITAQEARMDADVDQMSDEITEQEARIAADLAAGDSAIDGIDNQRNTMIAAIASVAGQGTDNTLTQQGVAADAQATGKLIAIQSSEPSGYSTKLWVNENAVDEYTVPTYGEHRTVHMTMLQNDVNTVLMASNPYANAFSTSNTYEVGDYVLVNGSHYDSPTPGSSTDPGTATLSSSAVYRCHTAVTTPGAWTGDANWTAVKVMDETKELKSAFAAKLPTPPTTDGAYMLTVTVTAGDPAYSWVSMGT